MDQLVNQGFDLLGVAGGETDILHWTLLLQQSQQQDRMVEEIEHHPIARIRHHEVDACSAQVGQRDLIDGAGFDVLHGHQPAEDAETQDDRLRGDAYWQR